MFDNLEELTFTSQPPETAGVAAEPESTMHPRRMRSRRLKDALRGIRLGIRGQSSYFVLFFVAALVLAAAIVLQCQALEWCILLGCVGMVLCAALFNSALEVLNERIRPHGMQRENNSIQIAAGAVLLAMFFGVAIIGILFLSKVAPVLGLK